MATREEKMEAFGQLLDILDELRNRRLLCRERGNGLL